MDKVPSVLDRLQAEASGQTSLAAAIGALAELDSECAAAHTRISHASALPGLRAEQCARLALVLAKASGSTLSEKYANLCTMDDKNGAAWPADSALSKTELLAAALALCDNLSATAADVAAANAVLSICDARRKLTQVMAGAVAKVAPNLCAVTGQIVAAELVGAAGSIAALASTPANVVLVMRRAQLNGSNLISVGGPKSRAGIIAQCPLALNAPADYVLQAQRMLASKAVLAARMDASCADLAGNYGMRLHAQIEAALTRLAAPTASARVRPIPPPNTGPSKRRGGRRARKLKERLGVDEAQRSAGRIAFGVAQDEGVVGEEIVAVDSSRSARAPRHMQRARKAL